MIITVNELRKMIETDKDDETLQFMLECLESFIVKYTNNNFLNRETKQIEYPPDVKMGVINLVGWDIENRDKIGIQSESISRHSVTYFNMDNDNADFGYPKTLLGFLKPYMRARF